MVQDVIVVLFSEMTQTDKVIVLLKLLKTGDTTIESIYWQEKQLVIIDKILARVNTKINDINPMEFKHFVEQQFETELSELQYLSLPTDESSALDLVVPQFQVKSILREKVLKFQLDV